MALRLFPLCLTIVVCNFAVSSRSRGVSIDWDNSSGDGNWNTPANWSTNIVPVGGDDAVFINPAAGPASITADIPSPRDIRIGDDTGGARAGSGTINQTAGTAQLAGWARIALAAGSTGTYNLSGTGTLSAGSYRFSEAAGTTSTLNVSGGTLVQRDVADLNLGDTWSRVGENGSVTVNLSGTGLISFDARIFLAAGPGSSATVEQTGGTFEVRRGDLTIGDNGTATYNISDGILRTLNASTESIVVGQWNNSNANLNVSGAALVEAGGNLVVANGDPNSTTVARGTVTQTGGTVRVGVTGGAGDLRLANDAEAIGVYHLQGGTLDLTGGDILRGAGSATFNMTGGVLTGAGTIIGNSANNTFNQQGGILEVGALPGAGSITTVNGNYTLGGGGTLKLDITQGTADQLLVLGSVNVDGQLNVQQVGGALGTQMTILANDDTDPVVGVFANAPHGVPFTQGGNVYTVFYNIGEGGNDIVLIPEPSALLALLAGAALLGMRQRRTR